MREKRTVPFFVSILLLLIGWAQALPLYAEGLPIKIGDTVEAIQKAYATTLEPEPYKVGMNNAGTKLHLKKEGVVVIFDAQGRASTIRLEAPFSGDIRGVKIGSSKAQIEKLLGPPDKKSFPPLVATESHDYYFEDMTTIRLAFSPVTSVQAIILFKSKTPEKMKSQDEQAAQNEEDIEGFSDNLTRTIRTAMREWKQRYVCGRTIKIRPFKGEETKFTGSGGEVKILKVEESAGPGWMNIDPDTQASIRNTVLHAMTHACPQTENTILPKPIPIKDGLIIGYQGASLVVKLKNGKQTLFTKFEEGLCERNASFFPGYYNFNDHYFSVGKLARQHFPQGQDPMSLARKNDVPGLASAVLHRPFESSPDDIQEIMSLYQKAWDDVKSAKH